MAGEAHAAQIEASFGYTASEHSYFGMGLCPGDFACKHDQFWSWPDWNKSARSIRGEMR